MHKQLFKISLLALFLFYYSGSLMFYHSHLIDGVKIVHSHPFPLNKTGETHSHTASEIATIKVLSHGIFLLTAAIFSFSLIEFILKALKQGNKTQHYENIAFLVKSMRAPPFTF